MQSQSRGNFYLALGAAVVTYLLLTVGGIVTSLDAGMIFLDWPLSDGSVNPDGWLRNPDKMSEHGHRILGALSGILTIALAVQLQRKDPRPLLRRLGWLALFFVCIQGALGGLRVIEDETLLAMIHGVTGQAFFGLMVALAYLTSRDAVETPEPGRDTRGLAICAVAAFFTIFVQIGVGARYRHVGGPLDNHLLGAFFTTGAVFWLLTWTMFAHGGRPRLRRPAMCLALLLCVQVALGMLSVDVLTTYRAGNPTLAQALVPSAHQSVGALMAAASLVIALRAMRRVQAREPASAGVAA